MLSQIINIFSKIPVYKNCQAYTTEYGDANDNGAIVFISGNKIRHETAVLGYHRHGQCRFSTILLL